MLHQPGDMIRDRYRIVKSLGQGGIGITYEAIDQTTGHPVAVKALSLRQLPDWKALDLFEREAKVLETLHHPAIPAYLDHFQVDLPQDRLFYLVQALAEGESLAQMVERGWRATEADARDIAAQVFTILNYLHRLNPPVIHRDIKPENIIRRQDGQIYLVDFGSVQAAYRNTVAGGGTFVGTFGYMPPEQFRGQVYFASDLYSLGGTILFLLTHRSPAELPQQRMKLNFRNQISVSAEFVDWLEQMVEPAVEDRFQSAEAALNALQLDRSSAPATRPRSQMVLGKPKGSRVKLQRSRDRLQIEIPPAGIADPELLGPSGFAAFWTGLLLFLTPAAIAGAYASGIWFFPLFLVPFYAAFLRLLGGVVFIAAGSTFLEINRSSFRQGWHCLGMSGERRGSTQDLRVEMESSEYFKTLTLWEGVHKQLSATGLTKVEQEWLNAELSSFLKEMRCW